MSFCGGSSMAYMGLQSHFRVQPNNCVEVVLRCVVVGVVTTMICLPTGLGSAKEGM